MKLVLLRHGESTWNKENRFTGWTDVGLTEKGIAEAKEAGQVLKAEGYTFDLAFTSVLKRAIRTLWIVMEEMSIMLHCCKRHIFIGEAGINEINIQLLDAKIRRGAK